MAITSSHPIMPIALQVHYVDCGEPYVKEGKVVTDLMPDFLHPNGPGA